MSFVKYNVLHWHLTDGKTLGTNTLVINICMCTYMLFCLPLKNCFVITDQSWPLVSTKYPNFTKNAAYRPYTIYNHADVEVSHRKYLYRVIESAPGKDDFVLTLRKSLRTLLIEGFE